MLFVRKHPLYQKSPTHQRQFLAPALTCCLPFPNLLNSISFLYKTPLPVTALLEKKEGKNHVKSMVLPLNGFRLPRFFDAKTCIQHQIGSLVCRQLIIFHSPKTAFYPQISTFLLPFCTFSTHIFYRAESFLPLHPQHFYTFCLPFRGKSQCIQQQIALHLAPKRTAFSTKTQCIQHQNAVCFASKRSAFCRKQHDIRIKQRPFSIKLRLTQHKHANSQLCTKLHFVPKPTLARIDFLPPVIRSATKKALTMLKIPLKTLHFRPYTTAHCLHKSPNNKPFAGLAKRARPRCVAITPFKSV